MKVEFTDSMAPYLESSDWIDWRTADVRAAAARLKGDGDDPVAIAERCFLFVRDVIRHSWDFRLNLVTCRASDVLAHGTGYCYAKSHLLAALLRANGIPAGLCYQRLTVTDSPPFCLHGLNAIYLAPFGWYRVDARGNKPGVEAAFRPPEEKLAFPLLVEGEADLPGVHARPLPEVISVLTRYDSWDAVAANLPDCPPAGLD